MGPKSVTKEFENNVYISGSSFSGRKANIKYFFIVLRNTKNGSLMEGNAKSRRINGYSDFNLA